MSDVQPARTILYRSAIPLFMLGLFSFFAFLWLAGFHAAYMEILTLAGIKPFDAFPFLDLHGGLAAAQCNREGVNVLQSDPCDVLGRPNVYSPFWLDIVPSWIGISDNAWLGICLDLLFITSLAWVFRPRDLGETILFTLASCSTMVVFALERANIDLAIFILIVAAGALQRRAFGARIIAYALIVFTGLLKYYPLILLALMARERLARCAVLVAALVLITVLFLSRYGAVMDIALAMVPRFKTYFAMDGFSAQFLPFGIVNLIRGFPEGFRFVAGAALLALLSITVGFGAVRFVNLLRTTEINWSDSEILMLLISCLIIVGCFFAGQNINYRGIFFLPMLPGLVALRRSSGDRSTRLWLSSLLAGIVFLMWDEFWRQKLEASVSFVTSNNQIFQTADRLLWLVRETIWWCVITPLTGIILIAIYSIPSDLRHQLYGYFDHSYGTPGNFTD